MLAFTDFKKPFLLETDASIEGLGAVLSQEQDDGRYHPVACASHGLKGGELKYRSSKLEFLALKWAMTKQFREYLQYQPFLIRTNNNRLTYVLTMPIKELLSHAMHYGVPWAESNDPRVTQEHEKAEEEIIMQVRMLVETKKKYQNLADSQSVIAQRGNQAI